MGPCHISYINYVFVDLGSWTLLFRQPVAALQIQNHRTLEWKWAKPQDATLTVNASDALSLLTGGYVKSTIHRCVAVVPYVVSFPSLILTVSIQVWLSHQKISNTSIVSVSFTSLGMA